jgi:hypothetical protein
MYVHMRSRITFHIVDSLTLTVNRDLTRVSLSKMVQMAKGHQLLDT